MEAARRVVETLFEINNDTFYGDDAAQINFSDRLHEVFDRHDVEVVRNHLVCGDEKSIPKAWREIAELIAGVL